MSRIRPKDICLIMAMIKLVLILATLEDGDY